MTVAQHAAGMKEQATAILAEALFLANTIDPRATYARDYAVSQ